MAEFQKVIRQYRRMLRTWKDSGVISEPDIEKAKVKFDTMLEDSAESFEHYIMQWAEEHPEHSYPSWADYLMDIGVLEKYLPHEAEYKIISALTKNEIPEEIAKKLQIKPVRNKNDQN